MAHQNVQYRIGQGMQDAVEKCQDAQVVCVETVNYCLEQGNLQLQNVKLVQTLLDCAEICQVTSNFLLRNSDFYTGVCQTCADICDQCARLCDQFKSDQQLRACGDLCRQCAQSVRELIGSTGMRRAA